MPTQAADKNTVNRIFKEKRDDLVDSGHLFETLLTRKRMLISDWDSYKETAQQREPANRNAAPKAYIRRVPGANRDRVF